MENKNPDKPLNLSDYTKSFLDSYTNHRKIKKKFTNYSYVPEDESKFRMDNLDNLNETELFYYERKLKKEFFPTWKKIAAILYHIPICVGSYYYMKKFPTIRATYFSQYPSTLGTVVKLGTIHAISFTSIYMLGLWAVSGTLHPIQYLKNIIIVQNKQADISTKYDLLMQEIFLFNNLKYFGVSNETINLVRKELENNYDELEKKNYFFYSRKCKNNDDDDEDEEEEENDDQ